MATSMGMGVAAAWAVYHGGSRAASKRITLAVRRMGRATPESIATRNRDDGAASSPTSKYPEGFDDRYFWRKAATRQGTDAQTNRTAVDQKENRRSYRCGS